MGISACTPARDLLHAIILSAARRTGPKQFLEFISLCTPGRTGNHKRAQNRIVTRRFLQKLNFPITSTATENFEFKIWNRKEDSPRTRSHIASMFHANKWPISNVCNCNVWRKSWNWNAKVKRLNVNGLLNDWWHLFVLPSLLELHLYLFERETFSFSNWN